MAIDRRAVIGWLTVGGVGTILPYPFLNRPDGSVYLSAYARKAETYSVIGFLPSGLPVFELPLPDRGHSFAVSPSGRTAVHFSRRPGVFALVIDLTHGAAVGTFSPPENRRFQGHGTFGPDGRFLYVSENDFEGVRGVIGVYDAINDYTRVGEFPSYGIGPHEIVLLPDGTTLAIANGGIATHPDLPRIKLNVPEMTPLLAYVDRQTGALLTEYRMDATLHQLSIRHLTTNRNKMVAVAMQYEGPRDDLVPLVALQRGRTLHPLPIPEAALRAMRQYCGSIAFDSSGKIIAASAPRGHVVTFWNADTGTWLASVPVVDGSGVAPSTCSGCFIVTSGRGSVWHIDAHTGETHALANGFVTPGHWDNHLMAVTC